MDTNVLLELAPILLVNFNQQVMVVLGMLLLGLPVLFAAENTKKKFNIPQGDAAETLQAFVEQSGEQIFFFVEHVRGYETRAVRGSFTSKEALTRMLEGSHLVFVTDEATGAVMVRKVPGQESDSSIPDSEIP
ncbi:MAG: hypothetical protein KJT03_11425, partial [Verrucomicrobiae bacterium]|nr:hypothetical protein [Verrucomicrobiae bacterium]